MSSRNKILKQLKKNKPEFLELPNIPDFRERGIDLLEAFMEMVYAMPGNVLQITENRTLTQLIWESFPTENRIASLVPDFLGNVEIEEIKRPAELKDVDLAVLPSRLGVAENGAVWLAEADCGFRILPFITQHLLVVLDRENIVADMHEACQRLQMEETGFGVFIAGPSKTADIEQSLVIGAQGARSFTVALR